MRLFLGLRPDDAAREALARTAALLCPLAPGFYMHPEGYHLTLAFLGRMAPEDLPAVGRAMEASVGGGPLTLRLGEVGAFGRILWRGLEASPELMRLSDRLRAALDAEGLPYDPKPLVPHITLARRAILPAALPTLPGAAMEARALILFESMRDGRPLAYLPRREVPL